MTPIEAVKRFLVMLLGLIITALGLSLCVRVNLGISPITTLAYTLSLAVPSLTIGAFTIFQHIVFFILTVILLGKKFRPYQILQLPCSLLFGWCLDFWEIVLRHIAVSHYAARFALLLVGCVIVAFGFSLIFTSRVALEANTAFVNALSLRTGKSYGLLKTVTDVAIVVIAAVVALLSLHTIVGIREGTVIAALIIGPIAGFFNRKIAWMERFFLPKAKV